MRAWPLLVLVNACVRPPREVAPPKPPMARCSTGVVPGLTRTGTIRGVASDSATGEPVAGLTVIATADSAQTQSAISDDHGVFALDVLPGIYMLTAYYSDQSGEQPCVNVNPGGSASISIQLDSQRTGGEVVEL